MPISSCFLGFQYRWINETLNYFSAAGRLRWFWQKAERITLKAMNMIICTQNVIELSWDMEHAKLWFTHCLCRGKDGKPWLYFQHKSGTCFLVQIQFGIVLSKGLDFFQLTLLFCLCFWRSMHVLLSTFKNKNRNSF